MARLPPPSLHSVSTAVTTCHSPTHVENARRDEENLCRGQLPPLTRHFCSPSSLLVPSFFPSCCRQLFSWVDGWRWRWKVRGGSRSGGLRDLTPMLSSWGPCCFLSRMCGSSRHEYGHTVAAVSSVYAVKLIYTCVSFIISLLHLDGAIGWV